MTRLFLFLLSMALPLAACGDGKDKGPGGPGGPGGPAPLVRAEPATPYRFVNRIEAVGTANAREQVTLSSPVTERIERLHFDDGGYVRSGQVVAELARSQETAILARAEAQAREAQQQLDRLQALSRRGFATTARVDEQIATVSAAQAQAAEARAMISDRVVRAPFSGYVSLRTVSPGAVIAAGSEIVTISDISEIKLDFPVPETALPALSEGQTIVAKSAAWPEIPFRGTVATIDPVVDPNTRSAMVRARLPNPDLKLKPGMLLTVAIETQPRMALAVPELAIVGEGERRFVFRVKPDSSIERVEVKVGGREDGRIEVLSGLNRGDKVVTDGVVKVRDGIKVRLAGAANAKPTAPAAGR